MALTLAGWSVLFLSAQPQAVQRYLAFPGRFGRTSAKITGTGKAFNSGPAGAAGVEPAQGHARTAEAHSHIFLRCRPDETCKTLQTTGRLV